MVHRDVKPANILLGRDGDAGVADALRARLSDFGIVRIADTPHLTHAAFTFGSASYLAPEQARGRDVAHLGRCLRPRPGAARGDHRRPSVRRPVHEAVAARLVTIAGHPARPCRRPGRVCSPR